MDRKLKGKALRAFQNVQAMDVELDANKCHKALENIGESVSELGGVTGIRLKMKPAPLDTLLVHNPDFHPGALHYLVKSSIEEEESFVAGVYAIPGKGVLKFYTDRNDPFGSARKFSGNETAFFQILLEHVHGCTDPGYWKSRSAPAFKKLLSSKP